MDPITILAMLGVCGLLIATLGAFVFHRSISSVRSSGRYTAPPEY